VPSTSRSGASDASSRKIRSGRASSRRSAGPATSSRRRSRSSRRNRTLRGSVSGGYPVSSHPRTPMAEKKRGQPPQHQKREPGLERDMTPRPQAAAPRREGIGKLEGKVALVTGGDS